MSIQALTSTCPASERPSSISSSAYDWLSRGLVVLVFTLLLFACVGGATQVVLEWGRQPVGPAFLHLAASISRGLFIALIVTTTLTRLRPIRKATGIEPRLSALMGTFLLLGLAVLPRADLPPIALAISSGLIIVGMGASFMVLSWLGKSFSIMPEARRLVTQGPYALVRHPLYLCEEIAVIGAFLQVVSPAAFFIVIIHALFQVRRMMNEEKVLKATFEDYESYAARTPRLMPLCRFG